MKAFIKWLPLVFVSSTALFTIIISHQTPRVANSKLELQAIQHAIEHAPAPTIDLSPIKAEVAKLAALIKQMQDNDAATFNTLIKNIKTELQGKFENIDEIIASIENKTYSVKILAPSSLPFTVISIDSLQHVSVATVAYDYKTTALEAGDALAGWQVKRVDFATQTMVFENAEGEVHLSLATGEFHA